MATTAVSSDPLDSLTNPYNRPITIFGANRVPTILDVYPANTSWEYIGTSPPTLYVTTGAGNWVVDVSGTGTVSNIETSSGTAMPSAGSISIIGNSLLNSSASGNTVNLTPSLGSYPITPFVVGPSSQAGYQTIQSAMTAANTAGGGAVWIQQGSYTENLTFYSGVNVSVATALDEGASGAVTIIGTHTPPDSGFLSIDGVRFVSGTNIFSSEVAGTTTIHLLSCGLDVTSGYTFNLPNWSGSLVVVNTNTFGTTDGFINNATGSSAIAVFASTVGAGTANSILIAGSIVTGAAYFNAPITFSGSATFFLDEGSTISGTVTVNGTASGTIRNSALPITNGTQTIVYNSSSTSYLANCFVSSNAEGNIFSGSALGNLSISDISYPAGSSFGFTDGPPGVSNFYVGNTLIATNAKTSYSTLATTTTAGGLSSGYVALAVGTATVSTTTVTASSRIRLTRQGINSSTALGNLGIGTITAGTSFVINSLNPTTPADLIAGDTSIVFWEIIN